MLKTVCCAIVIATGFILTITIRYTYAQESLYVGKTLRFIVGAPPGGGLDAYTRIIARHIAKYIPGNPSTIVDNQPGANTLIAANYTYFKAKPDGLTIGHFIGGLIIDQVLGLPEIKFDARKFEWIGAPAKLEAVCAFTKASGVTSVERWKKSSKPPKLGALGPGSETYNVPKILEHAVSLPSQVVSGYKGTADIRLAADSGEVDGTCWGWEVMKVQWRKALDAGDVNVVLQAVPKPQPDLTKVPLAIDFANTDKARKLIQVGIHDMSSILRPYALPPGTPKERVQTIRDAFIATMKDHEFLNEAKKAGLAIDPLGGAEFENIVSSIFKSDSSLLTELKAILTHKK